MVPLTGTGIVVHGRTAAGVALGLERFILVTPAMGMPLQHGLQDAYRYVGQTSRYYPESYRAIPHNGEYYHDPAAAYAAARIYLDHMCDVCHSREAYLEYADLRDGLLALHWRVVPIDIERTAGP